MSCHRGSLLHPIRAQKAASNFKRSARETDGGVINP